MKGTTIAISALSAALVMSNGWWIYSSLDFAHLYSDQQSTLRMTEEALNQSLAIINVTANPNISREEIIAEATRAALDTREPFDKEGYTWVGSLGLKFSESGRLLEARRAWSHSD